MTTAGVATGTEKVEEGRRPRRVRVGVVASSKADKTIKVVSTFSVRHRKYGKYLSRRQSFQVHDPANEAHDGDRVEIMECRPISKNKNWRLLRVLLKA